MAPGAGGLGHAPGMGASTSSDSATCPDGRVNGACFRQGWYNGWYNGQRKRQKEQRVTAL